MMKDNETCEQMPAHGLAFEDGLQEGLRLGHATTLRTEERGRATLAAYKAQIREARSVVLDLISSLPEDDRGRLAGVVAILTKLSTAEVP